MPSRFVTSDLRCGMRMAGHLRRCELCRASRWRSANRDCRQRYRPADCRQNALEFREAGCPECRWKVAAEATRQIESAGVGGVRRPLLHRRRRNSPDEGRRLHIRTRGNARVFESDRRISKSNGTPTIRSGSRCGGLWSSKKKAGTAATWTSIAVRRICRSFLRAEGLRVVPNVDAIENAG